MRADEGTYWSREACEVFSSSWEKCLSSSQEVKKPALKSLRIWVGGFSRNAKGPYLDSEISRMALFPNAKGNAVVGFVPSTGDDADDVSMEDEARLLGEASTAPSTHSEAEDHSEMEVEASPSEVSEAVQDVSSVLASPPSLSLSLLLQSRPQIPLVLLPSSL